LEKPQGEVAMKMTRFDRIMAIQRLPEFQEDYEHFLSLGEIEQKATYDSLCRKWGEDIRRVYILQMAFADHETDEYLREAFGRGVSLIPKPEEDHSEGRYAYFRIDLWANSRQLEKEFQKHIASLKKYSRASGEKKNRRTTYNPWKVWSLHHRDGLSLLEIARRFTGKDYTVGEKTPAYNEELWPPYKRVKAAHDQAEEMIQNVKKSVCPASS
jgi:hypothetical protein